MSPCVSVSEPSPRNSKVEDEVKFVYQHEDEVGVTILILVYLWTTFIQTYPNHFYPGSIAGPPNSRICPRDSLEVFSPWANRNIQKPEPVRQSDLKSKSCEYSELYPVP